MAITKERKNELVTQYSAWLKRSRALIMAEYIGLSMKDMDDLRVKVREAGGEFHIIKNTLGKLAFEEVGLPFSDDLFARSTAIGFAFAAAPEVAKVMMEFAKSSDCLKLKGGYLDNRQLDLDGIRFLAELPPIPVVRAQLLGVLIAPASKLVRTLAEPGRQIAAVVRAYAEPDANPAPA